MLDDAAELVVRTVPEWAALFALAALPLRLLEVHFANRLLQLGTHAGGHLDHLVSISWLITLALLPALWARAVFARACALALQSGLRVPPGLALRLPAAGFAGYLYAATAWDGLFLLLGWTLLALPLLALGSGLAAATAPMTSEAAAALGVSDAAAAAAATGAADAAGAGARRGGGGGVRSGATRPGPFASLALALRGAPPPAACLGLVVTFGAALAVAFVNLYALVRIGLWLAGGVAGLRLSAWSLALGYGNRHFLLLLLAGAVSLVEPFWLAALVAGVRAGRARESGEDLAGRFAELRAEPRAEGAA
ncbi:MAG: hypothetical protein JOZ15_05045 [Acidobacteria bacterium]|nr:hypothetical protein [Acidobacteriota bacterium]